MATLLNELSQMVTPQMAGQIGKMLNVDEKQVTEGVNMAGPLLLGAVANKAATPEGAEEILGSLKQDDGGNILGNLMGAIHHGEGIAMTDQLFGVGLNKVAAIMHDATGFDVAPFLPVVAPMVMGLLQRAAKTDNLDAAGLTKLVNNENDEFAKAQPLLSQQINAALDAGQEVVERAAQSKARFTPPEWDTLAKAPPLAGFAVMMSSLSGPMGMARESIALSEAMAITAQEAQGDSLVGLVSREFKDPEQINTLGANHENAATLATDACKSAVEILNAKAMPHEIHEYKQFIMNASTHVANAAKEGGFMGVGGTLVSDKEKAMLEQIAAALDYKP